MFKINSFAKTDVGRVRNHNEDAFILKPNLGLWALADGMGGEEKGEVASQIFMETMEEVFSGPPGRTEDEAYQGVQRAFGLANQRILEWARAKRVAKMGCTAELLVFSDSGYVLGHVGDSRTYRFRQGELKQLTRDHSLVQEQLDQGFITPAEARTHVFRNIILRAVGIDETLAVDILRGKCGAGDLFLLCSDGLTTAIDDQTIQVSLARPAGLDQKADRLIAEANQAGGYDNITVILCEVEAC